MIEPFENSIIPGNDVQRLEALRSYNILDSSAEESFNNIARLMADTFHVPIALISLVDQDKVFFKGNVGMPGVQYTDRKISLCSFAILSSEPTVFENALKEPCLLTNPLVQGDFGLRFYAGAPLTTSDGFHIGSVCILDKKERSFSPAQQNTLVRFSKLVMHEIELRQAAIKQAEAEVKYRNLFESMDQGYCTLEIIFDQENKCIDYRYLETNPSFEHHSGLINAVGKTIRELVPDIESSWFELYGNVAITGNPLHITEESKALNKWFNVHAIKIGGEKSRRVGVFFTDITQRKRAEDALRLSEERLQKVVSIETVGVIYFDLEGGIHDANLAFERLSGYSKEDFVSGKIRWDQLTPPEFMEVTLKSRDEFLTRGQNTPYEKQYIRPDGSRWWGLFAGKRLSETECVEFVLDITENKQAEALLEQRVKERTHELELRNKELEQFTFVSSHDLQEPLRKIIMFTDMVKTESYDRLPGSSQNRLDRVLSAARRMSAALRDVLDFASLNKEEQFTDVDLEQVLAAVQIDLELVIHEKNAKIISNTLPSIKAVLGQMLQLFYNLLSNALKFSKPGLPPTIHITCNMPGASEMAKYPELDQSKKYYEITVKDNGIGFSQEFADKIFVLFQRLHRKEDFAGTGIGLALCKKVVQNHNGKIWAESKEGEGTTFTMLLPV